MSNQPDRSTDELLSAISQKFCDLTYPPVVRITIDLACVRDWRLGALLSFIKTDVEYDYIRSRLQVYEQACDRKTPRYFPALQFPDTMVDDRVKTAEGWQKSVDNAPMTELYMRLRLMVESIVQFNQTRNLDKPLEIIFRIPKGKQLTKIQAALLFQCCGRPSDRVTISVRDFNFDELPASYLDAVQVWILDDLEEFANATNIAEPYIANSQMQEWVVLARPRLNDQFASDDPELNAANLDTVYNIFRLLSEFQFIPHRILTQ